MNGIKGDAFNQQGRDKATFTQYTWVRTALFLSPSVDILTRVAVGSCGNYSFRRSDTGILERPRSPNGIQN